MKYSVLVGGLIAFAAGAATLLMSPVEAGSSGHAPEPVSSAVTKTGGIEGEFISHKRLKTRGPTSERDVVLYLTSKSPAKHEPPKGPSVVLQEKLQFSPHVLPVLVGTQVSFENKDQVDHNVFAAESCCTVDSTAGPGKAVVYDFDKPGVASIVCRLHPDMSVWVLSLEEPWFTSLEVSKEKTPDGQRLYKGTYAITDVPAGDYELTLWNKKLKPATRSVTISAGETTKFDFVVEDD